MNLCRKHESLVGKGGDEPCIYCRRDELSFQVEKEHSCAGDLQDGLVKQYGELCEALDERDRVQRVAAGLLQKVHDLANHAGSIQFCKADPCVVMLHSEKLIASAPDPVRKVEELELQIEELKKQADAKNDLRAELAKADRLNGELKKVSIGLADVLNGGYHQGDNGLVVGRRQADEAVKRYAQLAIDAVNDSLAAEKRTHETPHAVRCECPVCKRS